MLQYMECGVVQGSPALCGFLFFALSGGCRVRTFKFTFQNRLGASDCITHRLHSSSFSWLVFRIL